MFISVQSAVTTAAYQVCPGVVAGLIPHLRAREIVEGCSGRSATSTVQEGAAALRDLGIHYNISADRYVREFLISHLRHREGTVVGDCAVALLRSRSDEARRALAEAYMYREDFMEKQPSWTGRGIAALTASEGVQGDAFHPVSELRFRIAEKGIYSWKPESVLRGVYTLLAMSREVLRSPRTIGNTIQGCLAHVASQSGDDPETAAIAARVTLVLGTGQLTERILGYVPCRPAFSP